MLCSSFSACRRVNEFGVRLGELGLSVWKMVVFVEADELMNGVERVSEVRL